MESTQQTPVNAFYGNADGSADNADTRITINQPPRGAAGSPVIAPFQPVLATQPAPAPAPVERIETISYPADSGERIGAQDIAQTKQETTTTVTHEKQINWGGILKGVAIVGAVVLVGVVGFYAASAAAGWALGTPAVASLAASTQAIVTPIATTIGTAAASAAGFLSNGVAIGANFIAGLTGTTGAVFTAGAATQSGVGMLVGGGAAAVAAHTAVPALGDIHLTTQADVAHHTTTLTPDHSTTTAHSDHASSSEHSGNIFSDIFASKSALTGTHALEGSAHMAEHLEHAQHSAVELGHHSTHADHAASASTGHANNMSSELADGGEHKETRKSWMDRVGGHRPAMAGGFASNIAQKSPSQITSRGTNFSQALDTDRANLEAALGEPTR